jgi:hypothetical protein
MMRRFLRNNGLSLAMFGLFAISLIGQILTGQREYNQDQTEHGEAAVDYGTYLGSGHFVEAVFENWESEFLQMAAYVMLTVMLFQKGSSESKDPDSEEPVDADPRASQNDPNAPWPVRKGGWILTLYEHSLGLSFFLLFLVSIALHARGGTEEYNEEQLVHGGQAISTLDYVGTARFWFESFQNWQSEFLSVGVIVVFSIFLRQRGSPESKPVAAPHSETGTN